MNEKFTQIKNWISKHIEVRYIIISIIAIIIFLPYLSDKFISGHDYKYHIANLFSIDYSISIEDGKLWPSKIRSVMANNLGYGSGIFYPQLPYYIIEIIYFFLKNLGVSLITAVKIFEFIVVLLTGIFMYKFMEKFSKNKNCALVSAILYMCAPYFINDLMIRFSLGEILIFLFIPIVLLAVSYLLDKDYKKFGILFVIGYTGLILSHLVVTLFFTILLAIVLLINIKELWNKKAILSFLIATVVVIGITAPSTFPMLEHKINGEYIVFGEEAMSSLQRLQERGLTFANIFSSQSKNGNIYAYTSIITFIFIGITAYRRKEVLKDLDDNQKKLFYSLIVFTVISYFISSKLLNWEYVPKILYFIQFPWRLCVFTAFGTSIIAGMAVKDLKPNYRKIAYALLLIVCIYDVKNITYSCNLKNVKPVDYSAATSMENRTLGAHAEYLPVGSNKGKKKVYLKNRTQDVIVTEGTAETKIMENKTPYFKFEIDIKDSEKVIVEIPRIFYFGYEIELEKEDGEKEKIEYRKNENGLIEFEVNKSGTITVDYTGTTINKIANVISIISTIGFTVGIIYVTKRRK